MKNQNSINSDELPRLFESFSYRRLAGGFLMFNACAIAMLWLGIVVPPLIDDFRIGPILLFREDKVWTCGAYRIPVNKILQSFEKFAGRQN